MPVLDFYKDVKSINPMLFSNSDGSVDDFDDEDLEDVDFSEINGEDFKSSFSSVRNKMRRVNTVKKRRPRKPLNQTIEVDKQATISGDKNQKIEKVISPSSRKVIVESVSNFVTGENNVYDALKSYSYHEGEKLQQVTMTLNNIDSAIDFNLELFNPSMLQDYLYSSSLNLNDKITVSGVSTQYSDWIWNMIGNPVWIVNAKFAFEGANIQQQIQQPLFFTNKEVTGVEKVEPLNISLQMDNMQVQGNLVVFNIMQQLARPYVPDAMDVIQYKVLAGNSIAMAFFFKRVSLKRLFFEEVKNNKKLIN